MACRISFMLLIACASISSAARAAERNTYPSPGHLDTERYNNSLTVDQRLDLDEINQRWLALEKNRAASLDEYKALKTKFRSWELRYDSNFVVKPYVLFMIAMCDLRQRRRSTARQLFEEIEKFFNKSPDKANAIFYQGVCYDENRDEEEARQTFERFLENPGHTHQKPLVYRARLWLKEYYRKRAPTSRTARDQYGEWLLRIAANYEANKHWRGESPRQRGDQVWQEAFDYFKEKEDWEACRKVAGVRFAETEIDHLLLKSRMDVDGAQWLASASDPEKQRHQQAKVDALLKEVRAELETLEAEDPAKHRDLYLHLVDWCARHHTPNDDFHTTAGTMMAEWMKQHPDDRGALRAFYESTKAGRVDPEGFGIAFQAFLKKTPDDGDVRWWYASTIRDRFDDLPKAAHELARYGGSDFDMGNLYKSHDWEQAAKHFVESYNTDKDPKRQQDAAWEAAEALRHARKYEEAIKFYNEAGRGFDTTYNVAECLHAQGEWEEAVKKLREIRNFSDDKRWQARAAYREGEILWDHDRKALIQIMRWAVKSVPNAAHPLNPHNFLVQRGINPKGGDME